MKGILLGIFVAFLFFIFPNIVSAYDYTKNCASSGSCSCKPTGVCASNPQCVNQNCGYSCPAAEPNSALAGNNCNPGDTGDANCECDLLCQGGSCSCTISGTCGYNCDEGYSWDGDSCEADNSCTPAEGEDWIIDCSDNCNLTSGSIDVDRLIFTGTGVVTFTDYDVGYSQRIVDHNCQVIRDYDSKFVLG